jgi:hypothetical protein
MGLVMVEFRRSSSARSSEGPCLRHLRLGPHYFRLADGYGAMRGELFVEG